MKRQLIAALFALFTLLSTMVTPVAYAQGSEDVTIEGGGWGHGIGMSQYGAYGMALDGNTAEEIVGYYYAGSSTAQVADQVGSESWLITDQRPLWIGLLKNKTIFRFTAVGGSLRVCVAGACPYTATAGEMWSWTVLGDGTCQILADDVAVGPPGSCQGTVKGMSPNGSHVRFPVLEDGRNEFARGVVRIRTPNSGATVHAALEIGLEDYMYGLAEVPFSWHQEALRAQALAGRSYATWRLISRGPEADFSPERKAECWCHMYPTTVDQNYSGWANEAAAGATAWKSAVDSTAGTVITHPDASQNNVVAAFYSSSTGGRTENVEDVWGGAPVGYLRSKADPWSSDPAVNNPFSRWSYSYSEDALATAYGVSKVDGMAIVDRFESGTPSHIDLYTQTGPSRQTITTTGPAMFSLLGLRGRNIRDFDYGSIPVIGGDFTGDGLADVAMVTGFSNTWWVGTSNSARFVAGPWLNHAANDELTFHVSGDFDGDGKDDVAAMQKASGRLLVGMSTGQAFRVEQWAHHADPTRWGPLVVGDFDGDGADDIGEYDTTAERWRIYRLAGDQVLAEYWYDFAVANPNWADHVVGDYNGDGLDDILSLDGNGGDLIVLFSDGTSLTPAPWQTLPAGNTWGSVQSADFTGDGIDDLGAYATNSKTWWVVAGRSSETGRAPQAWFTYANPNQVFTAQVVGDFTNDGKADIAAYRRNGQSKVLRASVDKFRVKLWGTVGAKRAITTVLAIDATGDGLTDLAAWDNNRRRWWIARSTGTRFEVSRGGNLLR